MYSGITFQASLMREVREVGQAVVDWLINQQYMKLLTFLLLLVLKKSVLYEIATNINVYNYFF